MVVRGLNYNQSAYLILLVPGASKDSY